MRKFISKYHAKIQVTFVSIGTLFFLVWLCIQPWNWIQPKTDLTSILTVLLCLLFFSAMTILIIGFWVTQPPKEKQPHIPPPFECRETNCDYPNCECGGK
jgi:hypothetical protein